MICVIVKSTSAMVCSHYVSLMKLISLYLSKQKEMSVLSGQGLCRQCNYACN